MGPSPAEPGRLARAPATDPMPSLESGRAAVHCRGGPALLTTSQSWESRGGLPPAPALSSSKGRGSGGNPLKDTLRVGGWEKRAEFFIPLSLSWSCRAMWTTVKAHIFYLTPCAPDSTQSGWVGIESLFPRDGVKSMGPKQITSVLPVRPG